MATPAPEETLRMALVINNAARIGGSERQCLLLATELARRNCTPILLSLAGDGPVLEQARRCGIETDAVALRFPLSPWYFPLNLIRAGRLFRRARPTVIIGYTSVPNLYAGWTWKYSRARGFIWNQRDEGLYRPPPLLEQHAMRSASHVVANSPASAAFVKRLGADHCSIIPNGAPRPPHATPRVLSNAGTLRVVYSANLRSVKDHATLLDAWKRIQARCRASGLVARLSLIGSADEEREYAQQILALAADPALGGTVEFCGVREDVFALLAQSDIGVMSSQTEGLPNAVLEYMAAGLPVAATDLPSIRHALGPDAGDCLAPPGNADMLAQRLWDLLVNPALRAEWGRRNRERAEREFSVEAVTTQLLNAIRATRP